MIPADPRLADAEKQLEQARRIAVALENQCAEQAAEIKELRARLALGDQPEQSAA